jgi:hypothetical protein
VPVPVQTMQFEATVMQVGRDRVIVPVPFDPDQVWGAKPRHHITDSVNGMRVRAVIEAVEDELGFVLGPAWRRDCGIEPGDRVQVQISPEGPQRAGLPRDLAVALEANPAAGQFFDSLRSSTARVTYTGSTRHNAAHNCAPNESPSSSIYSPMARRPDRDRATESNPSPTDLQRLDPGQAVRHARLAACGCVPPAVQE